MVYIQARQYLAAFMRDLKFGMISAPCWQGWVNFLGLMPLADL
jgi:hypothetical protein